MTYPKLPDIVEARKAAKAVYLATEESVADELARIINGLADEIERLRSRLEMDSAWQLIDGKMQRISVEPGSIPDGIECRDETIKLQKAEIARLRLRSPAPAEDGEGLREALKIAQQSLRGCRELFLHRGEQNIADMVERDSNRIIRALSSGRDGGKP